MDVAFDADATFWPFGRLAVARYQPFSVEGAPLSQPVQSDFAQLAPNRTISVSRTDESTVRIVVGGGVLVRGPGGRQVPDQSKKRTLGMRFEEDRRVTVQLQYRENPSDGDLGWVNQL